MRLLSRVGGGVISCLIASINAMICVSCVDSLLSTSVNFVASCLCIVSNDLNLTKERTPKILISTAKGLFKTDAAMIAPCSVKTKGGLRVPPHHTIASRPLAKTKNPTFL